MKIDVKKIVSEILKNDIKSVFFVGCGASKADLYPGYYFLKHNSTLKSAHLTANEFNFDTPKDVNEHSIVVTASLGGTTPETVEATNKALELGANVISLTNDDESPIAENPKYVIVHGFKESYAAKLEKMSYALLIAIEIAQQTDGVENYDKYIEGIEKLPEFVEKIAKSVRSDAKQFAKTFEKSDPIYVLGSGPTAEVAYATSLCLLLEMQWINSASIHSGEFFHGALEITDKDVPFILFMNEGKTRKLDERLLTFLLRFDAQVAVIDGKDFGLSTEFGSEVVDYFNPLVLTVVMRIYAEELSFIREHPLSKRRYMWKLEY
ncbi:SIS domain-containing protein [Helcococcus kunzii]